MVEGVKPIDAKVPSPSKENKMASRETQPIDYDEALRKERLVLFIFLGVIIVSTVLFFIWGSDQEQKHLVTISDFNIRQGVLLDLPGYSEISFNLNDISYVASFEVVEGKTELIIGDLKDSLNVGFPSFYDLNGDSQDDLFVRLEKFGDIEMSVYIQENYEFECPENWECTEWGPCINEKKNRVCVELNNCGTNLEKPLFFEAC